MSIQTPDDWIKIPDDEETFSLGVFTDAWRLDRSLYEEIGQQKKVLANLEAKRARLWREVNEYSMHCVNTQKVRRGRSYFIRTHTNVNDYGILARFCPTEAVANDPCSDGAVGDFGAVRMSECEAL